MKLKIENLAKIKQATFEFNGLTAIAGNNNTGKTTVGKTLFSIFSSLNNIDTKIQEERNKLTEQTVENELLEFLFGQSDKDDVQFSRLRINLFHEIVSNHLLKSSNKEFTKQDLEDLLSKFGIEDSEGKAIKLYHSLKEKMVEIAKVDDISYKKELLTRNFGKVFSNQINSLMVADQRASIDLYLKAKQMKLTFKDNQCIQVVQPLEIQKKAVYIDNPSIIDRVQGNLFYHRMLDFSPMEESLAYGLMKKPTTVLKSLIIQKKLEAVLRILIPVLPGEIITQNRELYIRDASLGDLLKISNLSTGLKSFAILKLLLENGALEDKDILILDEPEVHLHPEWQIIYAEVIVLLQKYFDLTVLLTTHSPYFLQAIETYSAKYEVADRCKYYLAENEGDFAAFEDVTGCTEKVYQQMLKPFEDLQSVTYGE